MKLRTFILLLPILTVCACGFFSENSSPYTEISESISMEPITPSPNVSHEERIKNVSNAISTIQSLYSQIQDSASQNNAPKKAVKETQNLVNKYGIRIEELTKLNLTNMSDDELREMSAELREIISEIRRVNDLF